MKKVIAYTVFSCSLVFSCENRSRSEQPSYDNFASNNEKKVLLENDTEIVPLKDSVEIRNQIFKNISIIRESDKSNDQIVEYLRLRFQFASFTHFLIGFEELLELLKEEKYKKKWEVLIQGYKSKCAPEYANFCDVEFYVFSEKLKAYSNPERQTEIDYLKSTLTKYQIENLDDPDFNLMLKSISLDHSHNGTSFKILSTILIYGEYFLMSVKNNPISVSQMEKWLKDLSRESFTDFEGDGYNYLARKKRYLLQSIKGADDSYVNEVRERIELIKIRQID